VKPNEIEDRLHAAKPGTIARVAFD